MSGERRQDARLERAASDIVDAVADALRLALPAEAGRLLDVLAPNARQDAEARALNGILSLLQLLGVDTSAHVTAPAVSIHVHRRPGHDEDV